MKTIIISDLHNRVEWVELALLSPVLQPYDRVVLLGDYFDDYHDTIRDVKNVARWLKQSLYKQNRIHLIGTHDIWYRFPHVYFIQASGNTEKKAYAIRSILTEEDWNQLKLFHYEQNFLMTHAGVHPDIINSYVNKNTHDIQDTSNVFDINSFNTNSEYIVENIIKSAIDKALIDTRNNIPNIWLGAGSARGGYQDFGGITWLDWRYEFKPIPNLNQIVGHTEMSIPERKYTSNSDNYCLDTRNEHIGILENGNFSYMKTIDVLEAMI